jgi:hypothetical protein
MFYTQFVQQYSQQVGNINEFLLRNNNYVLYRLNKQITDIILLYLGQNKSTSFFVISKIFETNVVLLDKS